MLICQRSAFLFSLQSFYPIINPSGYCLERVGGRAHAGDAEASGRYLQQCREVNVMEESNTNIFSTAILDIKQKSGLPYLPNELLQIITKHVDAGTFFASLLTTKGS